MNTNSIRFRLAVWYAAAVGLTLAVFAGLLWAGLRQRLVAEADADLAARADQFQQYTIHEAAEVPRAQLEDELDEFCQALPHSDFLQLRGAGGFYFQCPADAPAAQAFHEVTRRFRAGGEEFQVHVQGSLATVNHTLSLVEILLFSMVPFAVLVACAGGLWLSRRALKPVDEITAAARFIGINNLSQRLPLPGTGDEIERLTGVWNSMLARLEGAVNTLSQFAADASHELRTPLSVIRTTAELALRRARSAESYRESLAEIAAETERMTVLVDDLLFLARNDAQAAEMPKEELDLEGVVSDAASQLRGVAETRGIRVVRTGPQGLTRRVIVSGNRPALRRLFLVLLDNAIKYSHRNSEVRVEVAGGPGPIAVTIEDFGVGINEADRPHIFDRFYRADKARTDGGFGLGLSLADSIARAHGAAIDVRSEEGAGSRFRVVFCEADTR